MHSSRFARVRSLTRCAGVLWNRTSWRAKIKIAKRICTFAALACALHCVIGSHARALCDLPFKGTLACTRLRWGFPREARAHGTQSNARACARQNPGRCGKSLRRSGTLCNRRQGRSQLPQLRPQERRPAATAAGLGCEAHSRNGALDSLQHATRKTHAVTATNTQHATRNEQLSESFLRWEAAHGASVPGGGSDDDDDDYDYDSDETA